ncbi:MAG: hypothetical protein HYT62_00415 [Candidatus Yanofskybacteria bacterium]|nr:hypothetical protein [Candidatus Yanofskybacteria bacterium]
MSSRTLTKERVKTPVSFGGLDISSGALSLELIGDGPNEVIARRLQDIHERTDFMELKKVFSENFKVQLANMNGIDKKEISNLTSGLDRSAIEFLEKKLTSRCRIWAWFEKTIWASLLLLILLSLFRVFGETTFFFATIICGFGVGMPIIGPLICLMGYGDRDFFLTGNIGYMKDRKRLIKIYGKEYFLLPGLLS